MYKWICTRTDSVEKSELLQKLLFGLGYSWNSNRKEIRNQTSSYISLKYDKSNKDLYTSGPADRLSSDLKIVSLEEFLMFATGPSLPKIMIGEHEVLFNEDKSIKVGCKTIDFETLKSIWERVNNV